MNRSLFLTTALAGLTTASPANAVVKKRLRFMTHYALGACQLVPSLKWTYCSVHSGLLGIPTWLWTARLKERMIIVPGANVPLSCLLYTSDAADEEDSV